MEAQSNVRGNGMGRGLIGTLTKGLLFGLAWGALYGIVIALIVAFMLSDMGTNTEMGSAGPAGVLFIFGVLTAILIGAPVGGIMSVLAAGFAWILMGFARLPRWAIGACGGALASLVVALVAIAFTWRDAAGTSFALPADVDLQIGLFIPATLIAMAVNAWLMSKDKGFAARS